MKISDKLVLVFAVVIVCVVFLLGKSCGDNKDKNIIKPKEVITIKEYRDTIFPKDTLYITKIKIGKPRIDTVYDIIYVDSNMCNNVFIYEDSTITKDYNIYSIKRIQGILREEVRSVKLKVPLVIKDSVVITIKHDSLVFKPSKYVVHVGILATPRFLAPTLSLGIDRSTYMIGYDPFNKSPLIGCSFRLWKSKK